MIKNNIQICSNIVDKMRYKDYIRKNIFQKGSRIMFLFVIENAYEIIQTMQINMQGLNVVCKYSGYEEK